MPEEIEAKIRIGDPEAFRRRMAARARSAGETVFEVNRLFDDAAASLRGRGSALRVREEFRLPDRVRLRTILTFKGPPAAGPVKRRPEFELQVEAAEPLVAILEALGLSEAFRYEKRRTHFPPERVLPARWALRPGTSDIRARTGHGGACEVVLDEVPHLGWFTEIEGPTEEAVLAELADLGFADAPLIRASYIRLLREHLKSLGRDPTRAVFDE